MDSFSQIMAVVFVLALLGAGLWGMRRLGYARFSMPGTGKARTMQVLERLPLTPQHSLHLVDLAGHKMLVATSPGGCTILEPAAGKDLRMPQ